MAKAAKTKHQFPLWLHPTGQWCKKHLGRVHYFGTDKDTALRRYVDEWDDRKAGRIVRAAPDKAVRLADLCNHFLTTKTAAKDAGDLTARSLAEYHQTCAQVIAVMGKGRTVMDLNGDDFIRIKASMAGRYGPVAMGNFIQRCRTIFKHGYDAALYPVPVRFGPGFAKPKRRTVRLQRAAKPKRMIDPATLRKLIEEAGAPLEAMILLAVNCGFGQMDCSELPKAALSREGWIDFLRPKTAAPRRAPLWPETVEALERAIDTRPDPLNAEDDKLVFITRFGRRFLRWTEPRIVAGKERLGCRIDGVGQEFNKLVERLGLTLPGGFYTLRHVFRTVADGAKDSSAANLIMGHVDDSMAGAYREGIDDDRLQAVTDTVLAWLWPKKKS